LAEITGDILITCRGGVPTLQGADVPKVNFRVFYNTFVTSKMLNSSMMTESLLMIDDPAPADQDLCDWNVDDCGILGVGGEPGVDYSGENNVFPGKLILGNVLDDGNTVDWNGIPIDPPGTRSVRIIRITNVRANAARLGVGGGFFGSQIQAVVSLTSSTSIPVNQTALTVGFVQEGLKFANGSQNYLQCEPDGDVAISLTFKEQFGTAFKPKPTGNPNQNIPGAIYNAENNFVNIDLDSPYGAAGIASQATRLIAKFTNVPAGVTLTLSGTNSSYVSDQMAHVVSGADANGSGGTPGTSSITITPSGGAATATWEVVASNPTTLQNYVFTVQPNYSPNVQSGIPGLGSGLVAGSYGPLLNQPKYIPYGSTQVVPRFIDDSGDPVIFMTVNSCATNLLYPYIVNQGSFDTGIIISNTSDDPFGTANQTGSCDLYFYGNTDGGLAPDVYETPVIPAGAFAAFTLSGGGAVATDGTVTVVDNEIAAFPGFAGYMIAHCRFQYAHGYAFISDMGAQKLAQGYIALVLDEAIDFANGSRTGSKSEPLNQ